jgi:hypothetical protein
MTDTRPPGKRKKRPGPSRVGKIGNGKPGAPLYGETLFYIARLFRAQSLQAENDRVRFRRQGIPLAEGMWETTLDRLYEPRQLSAVLGTAGYGRKIESLEPIRRQKTSTRVGYQKLVPRDIRVRSRHHAGLVLQVVYELQHVFPGHVLGERVHEITVAETLPQGFKHAEERLAIQGGMLDEPDPIPAADEQLAAPDTDESNP